MLIRQEGGRSKKETEFMAEATKKGGIEEYLSTTTSKTTKNLQEVFSQLEQPLDGQHQRSVLVEGSPGVGKSVLLKHIAYLWAQGELLTNIDFLFLLHLRDPSVQQMHSLNDLIHYFYHYDKQACLDLTSCLLQDGGIFVTILFDGYDEFPVYLQHNTFIADLLQRKVLPACSIVVSSRPHASTLLRDNIGRQVEILGFSEQDQQHFIEHSLKDQPHKISELKQYLKHHSAISNLCFIPFNMTILLFLYKDKEERPLPSNSTGLYNLFICLTICRHLAKSDIALEEDIKDLNGFPQPYQKIINQLSKFAFKALGNNQLVFTQAEVKKVCPDIDKAINGFGLLQVVEYAGRMSKCLSFNFIHLSIQEFLAAYHVATLSPSKELSILQKNFWNNAVYLNMFDIYVSVTSGQRPSFRQFLQQPSLMEKFKKLFTGEEGSGRVSKQLLEHKFKCLRIYRCFQEAGDMVMCQSIEGITQLGKQVIDLTSTRLSPSDVECLAIFLSSSSRKVWEKLDLTNCLIQDHGLQILQRGTSGSNVTIKILVLNSNGLTAVSSSAISDLTISCRVETLHISINNIDGEDDRLYRVITDQSSMVEELNMSYNNLSSNGAIKLFTALSDAKKLRILWIVSNNIIDEACDAIVMAMKMNTSLIGLALYSPISGECAQFVVEALQYNDTLHQLHLISGYPEMKITSLEEEVNRKRETRGCRVKLHIGFIGNSM